jgi:hypothetical protein
VERDILDSCVPLNGHSHVLAFVNLADENVRKTLVRGSDVDNLGLTSKTDEGTLVRPRCQG